jgi:uncharacterized membrane protein YeaQ/YmgE (transglycosylase-associated protein family)
MWESITHWFELMLGIIGSFIAAVIGVAMRHAHKVQRGEPAPTWSRVWLDAPTVFVMGITGGAAGQWLHSSYGMPELFGGVIAASLGYLGPTVVDRALVWLENRKK